MLKTVSPFNTASPTFSGNTTLSTGNLVIGTAGKGIDFSANPSAPGMTSELLDDYEHGTWTPADASGAGLTLTVARSGCGLQSSSGVILATSDRLLNNWK